MFAGTLRLPACESGAETGIALRTFPALCVNMASIRRYRDGWRAEVARQGTRVSKVFPTKTEAKDWAAQQEYAIMNGAKLAAAMKLSEVIDRYLREVSPAHRGHRWEAMRLASFARDRIGSLSLGKITQSDISDWRERRLRDVSPGTVRREMVLLSAVFTTARKEWGLIQSSPMADVAKPSEPPPRDRLPTTEEMERLALVFGDDLSTRTGRVWQAFLFALETGMRAGEICGLTWERIDLSRRVCRLPMTKNGTAREVPLSSSAVAILERIPRMTPAFGLSTRQMDAIWRKARGRAGVDGLHFHDARHAAITRLARKLDVLSLARMVGHRDLGSLMVYYNESAADLAKRLD